MNRHFRISAACGLLAALLAVGASAPAGAFHDVYVEVTAITIDRVAYVAAKGAESIYVSGTLTCAGTGHAEYTDVAATQRGTYGLTNFDLLDFPCSTAPAPFRVVVETVSGCPSLDCFQQGAARVRATSPTLTVERMVTVKIR